MTHDNFVKYLPLAFYGMVFILIIYVGYNINKQNNDLDKIRARQENLIQVVKQQALASDKQVEFSAQQAKRLSAADLKIQRMLANNQCVSSIYKKQTAKNDKSRSAPLEFNSSDLGKSTVPSAPKQGKSLH